MKVKIRIEAEATTDRYVRFHGKAVDENLAEDWWIAKPEQQIGIAFRSFVHEQEVDLKSLRTHTVTYATSGYVPPRYDYAWRAKIFANDKLLGEGDVGRNQFLKVRFWLGPILGVIKIKRTLKSFRSILS